MNKKKSQLQIGENVIVLVIFFFLLVIAVIFYANIQKSNIASKKYEFESLHVLDLKNIISSLPQLQCSQNEVVTDSCLDLVNINIFQEYWGDIKDEGDNPARAYFVKRFGASNVTVRIIDPFTGEWTAEWLLYSNPVEETSAVRSVFMPVSLYNSSSLTPNDFSFGVLEIKVFSR